MNRLNRKVTHRLAELGSDQWVDRLSDGQIEVTWHRVALQFRIKDLLVLHKALQAWMEDPGREWAQSYCLRLNDCAIVLAYDEMPVFFNLVDDACCRLAHCPIHWADLRVEIVPCVGTMHLDLYRLN
ncbi:hypothetical protein GC175_06750 [bacterium]|nr:hypothetical protein [bacterium]